MEINLDYANARRLLLPAFDEAHLVLVGCGGTGSWLAPAVVRIARLLEERFNKLVKIGFVDPDTVEEKNVYRQNFCEAEIGRNKAEALAWRYGLAWGREIVAARENFSEKMLGTRRLTVVLGCVDNAAARREIDVAVKEFYPGALGWWIDCGNERNAGQVLAGCGAKPSKGVEQLTGVTAWLPSPAVQHPDLLESTPMRSGESGLSCAEMALADAQGMTINQRMAAEAADYLARMLITKDLRKFATYIDLESGTSRSRYITDEAMKEWNETN